MLNANLAVNHKPGDSTLLQGGLALAKGHVAQWPQWIYGRLGELDATLHWQEAGRFHGEVRHVQLQAFDPTRPEQGIGQASGAGSLIRSRVNGNGPLNLPDLNTQFWLPW